MCIFSCVNCVCTTIVRLCTASCVVYVLRSYGYVLPVVLCMYYDCTAMYCQLCCVCTTILRLYGYVLPGVLCMYYDSTIVRLCTARCVVYVLRLYGYVLPVVLCMYYDCTAMYYDCTTMYLQHALHTWRISRAL